MLLITGATGNNGAEPSKALAERGVRFRALVRSRDGAEKIKGLPGVELVVGDFDQPDSLSRALEGVERAFLLTDSSDRAETRQKTFVRCAAQAGVQHIVKLSQYAAHVDSPVRLLRYHAAVEQAIIDSGVAYTFLRPDLYMQGLLLFKQMIQVEGRFYACAGDGAYFAGERYGSGSRALLIGAGTRAGSISRR